MSRKEEENIEFCIPESFIEKIYELSGGVDKNKGLILALCIESGTPTIYSRHDSVVVELGLKKALSDYLKETAQKQNQ
jgi:hypothetical protein